MTTATDATRRVEHPTRTQRAARGKAARAEVPRRSHAGFQAPANRRDPVAVLEEQAQTRVPELVPIRYGRMLVSPFTFYRGARRPDGRRPGRRARGRACRSSSAATRTCRTSAPSLRPTGDWSSASTTSTRRFPARSSGTSSVSSRASRSPAATAGSTPSQREPIDLAVARSYREAMREFAADASARALVRAGDIDDLAGAGQRRRTPSKLKRFERNVAKAGPRTACGPSTD